MYRSRAGVFNAYEGYRVIDTCPISVGRSNREPKCGRQNRTTLEDFIWVSDKTGKIYQNIHFAKCHGIEEPITWQIQTTCADIMLISCWPNLIILSKLYFVRNAIQ